MAPRLAPSVAAPDGHFPGASQLVSALLRGFLATERKLYECLIAWLADGAILFCIRGQ